MSDHTAENHPGHEMPEPYCPKTFCGGWTTMVTAKDVTEEVVDMAEGVAEGTLDDRGRIDWERVFDDRLEGARLDDGTSLSLGTEYDTPAQRKIKREVRKRLSESR